MSLLLSLIQSLTMGIHQTKLMIVNLKLNPIDTSRMNNVEKISMSLFFGFMKFYFLDYLQHI